MKTYVCALTLICSSYIMHAQPARQQIIQQLCDHGIIQRGTFVLKSGQTSPYYVDMRKTYSIASVFHALIDVVADICGDLCYDCICGVPTGAIPFASAVAYKLHKPSIMLRKEVKNYGLQKLIEGVYNAGDKVLLIEDVTTTGSSILEAITMLENAGLVVSDIIVLFDRQQGGTEYLQAKGYRVHSLMQATDLQ